MVGQSVGLVSKSDDRVGESVSWWVGRSVGRSVAVWIGRSAGQSLSGWLGGSVLSVGWFLGSFI